MTTDLEQRLAYCLGQFEASHAVKEAMTVNGHSHPWPTDEDPDPQPYMRRTDCNCRLCVDARMVLADVHAE